MYDGDLREVTCIFSKLIPIKLLCSGALWEEKGSLNDKCCGLGVLYMVLMFLSQKSTTRGCFIKLSVQLFT